MRSLKEKLKEPLRDELFNIEQLIQHAEMLADEYQLSDHKKDNNLLERLNYNSKILYTFNKESLILKKPHNITPAAYWLIDNFYLIEEQIQLSIRHFPKEYSKQLPCLSTGDQKGNPRVYSLVLEIISHADAQIDEDSLLAFINAYQSKAELKLGELWAIPIMLRMALIENLQRIVSRLNEKRLHRELANSWVDKLQSIAKSKPSRLIEVVSDMAKSHITMSSAFVSEFCQRISSQNQVLQIARTWLEQRLNEEGLSIEELIHAESQSQAANQLSVSHSINSFRTIGSINWKNFVEASSIVEQTLRTDPANIYHLMDFSTRDNYRHAIEVFASKSKYSESQVAEQLILLAKKSQATDRSSHIGYYLIEDGQQELNFALNIKTTFKSYLVYLIHRSPLFFYGGSILLLSLLGVFVFIWILQSQNVFLDTWRLIILALIFLLCISQAVVDLVNWLYMLFIKPKILPRLDFSKNIPPECRTMVVIPTMLVNTDSINSLIENIELHYLSNRAENLHFALITDFMDASEGVIPSDKRLLEQVTYAIEALNIKYPSEVGSNFYLLHRERQWNPNENTWMGYERKRGKLMELNALLKRGRQNGFSEIVGDTSIFSSIKYVITLDTDTQLPGGTAPKLIGAMAHPLNHPIFDPHRNIVVKGYGIIQPRVATNLLSSQKSIFARLISGDTGIDPYTRAISDVYQDIFREGSYIGKGIYDVDAFEKVLRGRFPENKILSHDLLESTYVRSALINDVEMYESYPSGYNMDAIRRHRWIRGDWQIIQWLLPRVPTQQKMEKNPISRLGKWKLMDNLRRSLIAPGLLSIFILFFILSSKSIWLISILIPTIILLPLVLSLLTNIVSKPKDQSLWLFLQEIAQKTVRQFITILFLLILLPYEAFISGTAISVSLWRLIISHRHLLSWKTSKATELAIGNSISSFYKQMWFAPTLSIACSLLLIIFNPTLLLYSLPIWVLWSIAPGIAWYISRPIKKGKVSFSEEQTLLLHRISRKTWHFFETFVTAKENWLPPDNFQEIPEPVIASRTSPTNMGLSLLANLSAYDFGYISAGKMLERTELTFSSMDNLEKYNNHFYNWYNTRTLEPLNPKYVSSVDSGNLAGHLLTLNEGIKELKNAPIYTPNIFAGLLDTVRVINEYDPNNILEQLEKDLEMRPEDLKGALILLKHTKYQIENLPKDEDNEVVQIWIQTLLQNCNDHLNDLLYLAPWLNIEHPEFKITINDNSDGIIKGINSFDTLSLNDICMFKQTLLPIIKSTLENPADEDSDIGRLTEYNSSLLKAIDNATNRIRKINTLANRCDAFSKMDFTFLYNTSKKLFTIGYNVTEQRIDSGSYDMLASEARLCSYVAISQGQIPQEHWFSLSRLLLITHNKPVLLSWSGSMFEYLMPLLVMPNYEHTLLDGTYTGAVKSQIEYGNALGVPWGISESGYNRIDTLLNYQYKAFGIPSLGLQRGLSKDLVITPYATVMALMVAPIKASENMQRLTSEGHEGTYGYYEAIDYTPSHLPPNESSVNINSFMAHHQGMSLIALTNLIKNNAMQRRFMQCPMLKANELLLQERIPRSIASNIISDDSEYEIEGLHPLLTDSSDIERNFKDMNISPEVNLLSNGHYNIMVNNNGAGYSRWNNLAVTRWREDATSDNLGLFVYLRDTNANTFWTTTNQPAINRTKKNEAIFTQAYAEFRQQQSKLDVLTTICISPEDDIELRRVSITNHSQKERIIELTTYSEVVIAPQSSDESHPAFSNLFVQTEFASELSAIFCTRRARSEDETPPHLVHLMIVPENQKNEISCETDRSLFIGRGNTLNNPLAMQKSGALTNSSGSVLDPAISLRQSIAIPAGETVTVYVLLGMAENQDAILTLADKYQDIRMSERAFELAWTHSQIVLQQLNITEAEAQLYSKLAGSLVYVNSGLRASQTILKANKRGQNSLWGYSISGDIPLILVRISKASGMDLVRQLVLAHAYWRMKGLATELVILNEDVSVYHQSVHDKIVNLISYGIEAPLLEKAAGIFVRRIEQVPREDVLLLLATARIVLSDEYGTLAKQLETLDMGTSKMPTLYPQSMPVAIRERQENPQNLIFNNGLGGFTPDGKEYVITLNKGQTSPAPWCNVLANEQFGTVISESGGAYTWAENAHEFRITPWNNDPVKDTSGEAFYIRDEQTGQFWSPTPLPAQGTTPYTIRHGFGYTIFEHNENGIESTLTVYVAMDSTIKLSVLKIHNISGRPRKISVTGYNEWVLADLRQKSLSHVQTEVDVQTGVLFARNFYNVEFADKIVFMDVDEARTLTGDRSEFIGRNGNLSNPSAMKLARLSGKVGAGLDSCGAMQITFELAIGQERETRFRLGFANNEEDMHRLVYRYRQTGSAKKELSTIKEYWAKTLGVIEVSTPDASVNIMANGWLLYQTLSSRIWARSGYYQSGGAYGFRDQLQDVMALVHAEPSITRKQILLAASRQFKEGDVQHWWHPPIGRGVRTHFSDDYLWLPYVVSKYVTSVGDKEILSENVPFIEGRLLGANEESYYDLPSQSEESATIYEHCVRSIKYGLKFGKHGLPLMGCGDWNDGMNLVGKDGKGESVWLAFFLYDVLIKFSKLAIIQNDDSFAQHCTEQAEKLRQNIREHAWDGEWYRRAFFDDGTPLGSKSNNECSIDSLPQSWSIISAAGDKNRSLSGMLQIEKQLINTEGRLIQLFSPPFNKSNLNPGYIKGYIPGVRENGGQYTHAAIWTVLAFTLMNEVDKAWELFDLINPINHGSTSEQISTYKVEPYVVAADIYATEGHLGRGGWTWYTGSSAWMYCLLVETLLGINLVNNKLNLTPHLPKKWNSYKVQYKYKSTIYSITFSRIFDESEPRIVFDGKELGQEYILPLIDDNSEHFVDIFIV